MGGHEVQGAGRWGDWNWFLGKHSRKNAEDCGGEKTAGKDSLRRR